MANSTDLSSKQKIYRPVKYLIAFSSSASSGGGGRGSRYFPKVAIQQVHQPDLRGVMGWAPASSSKKSSPLLLLPAASHMLANQTLCVALRN
jgi:hypothetical protein